MPDVAFQKASLFGETKKAIKQSMPTMKQPLILYGLALSVIYFFMMIPSELQKQLQEDPTLLQKHPEMVMQMMHETLVNSIWLLPIMLMSIVANYFFTVTYLRVAMVNNRPELSADGFKYWFGKVFLKWLRVFWILIPLAGFFIYLHSIIRYQVVSPIAVLKRGNELKTSWDLTKGNWWRVFGNYLLLVLVYFVLPMIALGIVGGIIGLAMGMHARPLPVRVIYSLVYGFVAAGTACFVCIFTCITYRVLSQEARAANAPAPTTAPQA